MKVYVRQNQKFEKIWNKTINFSKKEEAFLNKIEELRASLLLNKTEVFIEPIIERKPLPGGKAKTVCFIAQRAAKSRSVCRLLYSIVRCFKPKICLEFGTSLGLSGAYFAAAQYFNENGGKLITLEGAASLASLAQSNFEFLGLKNVEVIYGLFEDVLEDVLIKYRPVDCVYHDGNITKDARFEYFELCRPFLSKEALFLLSCANRENAWESLLKRYSNDIEFAAITKGSTGILMIK
jgi:predicted O-methyltransferase YrrM